jgi:hypothetical protein
LFRYTERMNLTQKYALLPKTPIAHALSIALTLFLGANTFSTPHCQADDIITVVIKKEEEKRKTRWSLSEWLETRDKMRLMDLWLALHSPSPYEFFVGAEGVFPSTSAQGALQSRVRAAAYASIFGFEFSRDFGGSATRAETQGQFNLRLLGYHAQGTNLTLFGGLRFQDAAGGSVRNGYTGTDLTFYISRFAGLQGQYRWNFGPVVNPTALTASGAEWNALGFVDFKFLRVFGGYQAHQETGVGAQTQTAWLAGTRLFF